MNKNNPLLVVLLLIIIVLLAFLVFKSKNNSSILPATTESNIESNVLPVSDTTVEPQNKTTIPAPTKAPTPEPKKNIVSLGQEFTIIKNETVSVLNTGLEVEITDFYNNPCTGQCIWSGIGIGFEYRLNGKTEKGINLMQAFGYQTTVTKTDNETYASIKITKI